MHINLNDQVRVTLRESGVELIEAYYRRRVVDCPYKGLKSGSVLTLQLHEVMHILGPGMGAFQSPCDTQLEVL